MNAALLSRYGFAFRARMEDTTTLYRDFRFWFVLVSLAMLVRLIMASYP